jgi:alpha-glucoside transport system substrate-binding protein
MIKLIKNAGVFLVIALLVAACAPATTPAPTTVPTQQPTAMPPTTMPPAMTETMAPTTVPVAGGNINCMGAASGDTLSVVYEWSGSEQTQFNAIMKPLVDACGIKINATTTRDPAVLDTMVKSTPPDIVFWPDLSPLKLYASMLKPLDTVGGDMSNYANFWITLGSVNNQWLAIPAAVDIKSLIWYSPARFAALGYTVPTTFADLQTLVDKMAADGNIPWSTGLNNGGSADGWPGTDFIQDILLATQGPDYVDGIIAGTTPYNDQGVIDAYTLYQKWTSDPKYSVGGANGAVNTPFLNAIYQVFQPNPLAMMVKQSGFAGGSIATQFPTLKYGTDYDFFEFPGVKGVQGGGDFMMAFNNSPAAQALVAYVTSATGGENWAANNFHLTPNTGGTGKYTDPLELKFGDILANASGFTFDIGDALGAPFNTAEFAAVMSIVQGADIKTTLDGVAAAQAQTVK